MAMAGLADATKLPLVLDTMTGRLEAMLSSA
jgi:hypothetical protein